jgi:release factor glutamine methyltransferase
MIPVHERRVLEAHVRGLRVSELIMEADQELNEYEKRELKELILMRMKGIPLQYLVRSQDFYGREFYVDTAVLIPRPETEGLVEHVLKRMEVWDKESLGHRPHILDFGTGSGCIGLTLALERMDARVWGSEASQEAADVAHENAKKHRTINYDVIHCSDPPLALQYELLPPLDVIVSNPPYLAAEDDIADDVRQYEPPEALFPPEGRDPLFYYAFLADLCAEKLAEGGFGAFEIAENRGSETAALFTAKGFDTELKQDLTGRTRYLLVY